MMSELVGDPSQRRGQHECERLRRDRTLRQYNGDIRSAPWGTPDRDGVRSVNKVARCKAAPVEVAADDYACQLLWPLGEE